MWSSFTYKMGTHRHVHKTIAKSEVFFAKHHCVVIVYHSLQRLSDLQHLKQSNVLNPSLHYFTSQRRKTMFALHFLSVFSFPSLCWFSEGALQGFIQLVRNCNVSIVGRLLQNFVASHWSTKQLKTINMASSFSCSLDNTIPSWSMCLFEGNRGEMSLSLLSLSLVGIAVVNGYSHLQ